MHEMSRKIYCEKLRASYHLFLQQDWFQIHTQQRHSLHNLKINGKLTSVDSAVVQ